jgi:hypothetical protein
MARVPCRAGRLFYWALADRAARDSSRKYVRDGTVDASLLADITHRPERKCTGG